MYVLANGVKVTEYPYSVEKLRRDNPQVSFPVDAPEHLLAAYNVFAVQMTEPQIDPATEVADAAGCAFNEQTGCWETVWVVRAKTAEEIAEEAASKAEEVRQERDARLAACDWTQLSDAPVNSLAWANYRQGLRDITTQPGFPWTIQWPATPVDRG
jgi:hypothetical protein